MSSVDKQEIENFSKDSCHWWNKNGPFAPLHALNPTRMSYIKTQICKALDLDVQSLSPFNNLSIADIGCGGGLVCEPLARLGANVTGIDADENAIKVAKKHAKDAGLNIAYKAAAIEEIDTKFDVVCALEIIEHVSDPQDFVTTLAQRVKPDGIIILSTLNRNPKSFALGVIAAEYILRWVPRGTHNWKKFIKPSELARFGRKAGLETQNITGLIFDPAKNDFRLSGSDLDVNYLMSMRLAS